ncbi:MAG: hypothetical protein AB7O26_01480 [Planctomycetaceae bacterium]
MPVPLADESRPFRMRLPRSRRLTIDVLHYHRQVPTCAHDRCMNLGPLAAVREQLSKRVSWSMLFVKAFGIVAREYPVLRQTCMRWPFPHIYQHPHSVAMVATHREIDGEAWLFWSRFSRPETQTLAELQSSLEDYLHSPAKTVFLRQWQLSAFPTFIRRFFWWWTLNVSGVKRAKRSGTFFLTTIAGKGAEIQHPPAFLTSNFTYGPLDENHCCRVTIAYDHRLMDGSMVANCLARLETVLNQTIAEELRTIVASERHEAPALRRTA